MIWSAIARFLARPAVADWIIRRAERMPYTHLVTMARTGRVLCIGPQIEPVPGDYWYMRRFWLLRLGPLEMRVHHILAEDPGRDVHDHPWPFRTFILRGGYVETRDGRPVWRQAGTTATLGRGEFHRIAQVADGGAWTLFVTWGARRGWGFKRSDGSFVPHEEY